MSGLLVSCVGIAEVSDRTRSIGALFHLTGRIFTFKRLLRASSMLNVKMGSAREGGRPAACR